MNRKYSTGAQRDSDKGKPSHSRFAEIMAREKRDEGGNMKQLLVYLIELLGGYKEKDIELIEPKWR